MWRFSSADFRFWVMHVLFPLGLGGACYLVWRDDGLLLFRWIDALGLGEPVSAARSVAAPLGPSLPGWVRFNLPGGVFAYGTTACIGGLWRGVSAWEGRLWALSGWLICVGWELGQGAGLVAGTFDLADLAWVSALAGAALGVVARRGTTDD